MKWLSGMLNSILTEFGVNRTYNIYFIEVQHSSF